MKSKTSLYWGHFKDEHRKETGGISAELANISQRVFGEIMNCIETNYLNVSQRSNNRSEL